MDGSEGSMRDPDAPHQFAALLNALFATRLAPSGRPYTLTEVSRATKLSVSYLSLLRSGGIDAVPFDRVDALARFFQVPLDYFSQQVSPAERQAALARAARTQELGRDRLPPRGHRRAGAGGGACLAGRCRHLGIPGRRPRHHRR